MTGGANDWVETEFQQAQRHVDRGKQIVAEQVERVLLIKELGGDLRTAEILLDEFRQSLAIFEDDLKRLRNVR